jgi:hypothetical protein
MNHEHFILSSSRAVVCSCCVVPTFEPPVDLPPLCTDWGIEEDLVPEQNELVHLLLRCAMMAVMEGTCPTRMYLPHQPRQSEHHFITLRSCSHSSQQRLFGRKCSERKTTFKDGADWSHWTCQASLSDPPASTIIAVFPPPSLSVSAVPGRVPLWSFE